MLLSKPAPLNKKVYAGHMYFTLAQTFLEVMGKPVPDFSQGVPRLGTPDEAIQYARSVLAGIEAEIPPTRIMIHPGVSRMSVQKNILKAWPIACWQELMLSLAQRHPHAPIYLLGGPDDAEVIAALEAFREGLSPELQARIVNLYGKTRSFQELAGLIALADVLISVDSAPMHLAVGLNRNVVAIFSPTDPKKLVPMVPNVEVAIRDDLSCRPCLWDTRKVSCDTPVCLDVPVSLVLEKTECLLNRQVSL
jgi:ADP-heptose:LPS heptosyltransferase